MVILSQIHFFLFILSVVRVYSRSCNHVRASGGQLPSGLGHANENCS